MKKSYPVIIALLVIALASMAQANNLALQGTATQSSNAYPDQGHAGKANDGNTNGNWFAGSVTHTNAEQAWWQVDLLATYRINEIVVWNRTDVAYERLSDFYVSVLAADGATEVWKNNYPLFIQTTGTYPLGNDSGMAIELPANTAGQFVKVGLNGINYLSLAEVQVICKSFPVEAVGLLMETED
jgi:hypothetical protein